MWYNISSKEKGAFFMAYENYFKEPSTSMTIEEKIELAKSNIATAAALTKEMKTLQATKNATIETISDNIVCSSSSKETIKTEDKQVEELANKISLLDIDGLSLEEIMSELNKILGIYNNQLIINKIKLMLYKEYLIYNKMILTVDSEIELQEIQDMMNTITTKIDLLDEMEELDIEEDLTDEITGNNNLFFLLSDSGKVIALESLRKNVPRDYYSAFKELIIGLKEGKLKGTKKLRRHGYLELKNFKIRVTFDKLSNGNYIILDAFMKKVYTSVSYRNNLANKTSRYQQKREFYLAKHKDPEFLKEHEGYLAEVLTLLDNKTLEGDDLNETKAI